MSETYTMVYPPVPGMSDAPVVHLNINKDGATDYELVEGVSGSKIRIVSARLSSAASIKAWFVSDGATDTEMMGVDGAPLSTYPLRIGVGMYDYLETESGDALDLRASGTGSIDGWIKYQVIRA